MWWNSTSCLNESGWLFCLALMALVAFLCMGVCIFFREKMGMLGCCGSNDRSHCGGFSKLDTKDNDQGK